MQPEHALISQSSQVCHPSDLFLHPPPKKKEEEEKEK